MRLVGRGMEQGPPSRAAAASIPRSGTCAPGP
jgi:hypothetical protein